MFLLMMMGLAAVFGAVATAHAGTITKWSSLQPRGVVTVNLPVIAIGSGLYDGNPMSAATSKLHVDGFLIPKSAYTGIARTVNSVYFFYNPPTPLPDGFHTFRVEMSDTAGKVSFKEWGALIAQPPTAAWLEPVANWVMYSGYPRITMRIADNTIGTTMDVLGAVRTGSATGPVLMTFGGNGLSAGDHSFALPGELPPGTYYLTATVTDAAGNALLLQGTSARKFTTQAAPAMSVLPSNCLAAGCHVRTGHPAQGNDCSSCHVRIYHENANCGECHDAHTGPVTVTDMFGNCESCHNVSNPTVPRHTVDSVRPSHDASCGGCHYSNLLDVHGVIPAGKSYAYQCGVCHESTDTDVSAAIVGRASDCDACHTEYHADFGASHTAPTETCSGAGCHASTALVDTHESYVGPGGRYPQYADTCALCHTNEDPDRVPASATAECASCHDGKLNPDGSVVDHGYTSAKHTTSESCLGTCHSAELNPAHDAEATATITECADCHDTLVAAINPWDGTCSECHPTTTPTAHQTPGVSHAGSDALVRDYTSNFPVRTAMSTRIYPFGCTPTASTGQTICHNVSNLATLHEETPGKGCGICHGADRAAPAGANECLTCHGTGWYAPSISKGTIARPGSDYSSSGTITSVGGSGSDNFSTQLTNDGAASYLQFGSANAEAMFGRGTWWLNPNTTTVTSVQVLFRAMKLGLATTTSRITVVMNVGGTTYVSTAVATNPSAAAYTLYTHTFATNPKTGVAWTPADLNDPASENGLRAFGVRQTVADTANIGVTEVYLKVNTPDTAYVTAATSGGQAHHYGNYLRSPQTPDGEWSSAVYTQYCYDRCHVFPNTYAYYGQVLGNPTYNPFNAYEGTQMWSSLMGDPNGNSPKVRNLTLSPIDLPAGSPQLDFMTNYALGTGDNGYVELSTDGGSSWTTLSGTEGGTPVSAFSGIAGSWRPASYDLSAFAGQQVTLRFRYTNMAGATTAGWCIDNVSVSEGGTVLFSDDAETLKPEWDPGSHWRRIQYALRWLG